MTPTPPTHGLIAMCDWVVWEWMVDALSPRTSNLSIELTEKKPLKLFATFSCRRRYVIVKWYFISEYCFKGKCASKEVVFINETGTAVRKNR